jgi:hypothetical protein
MLVGGLLVIAAGIISLAPPTAPDRQGRSTCRLIRYYVTSKPIQNRYRHRLSLAPVASNDVE